MKKRFLMFFSLLIITTLLLAACGPADDTGEDIMEPTLEVTGLLETEGVEDGEALPETGNTQTAPAGGPEATETTAVESGETTEATEATQEAEGEVDGTPEATGQVSPGGATPFNDYRYISQLLTFTVQDAGGSPIGDVDDMILNVCEARIDYLVVGPDASLELPEGRSIVIPFQAVNHDIPGAGSDENTDQNQSTGTPEAGTTPEASATETEQEDGMTGTDQIPGVSQGNFVLEDDITSDVVTAAPINTGQVNFLAEGWDDEISTYWEEILGETVTTECTVAPMAGTGEDGAQAETTPTVAATAEATQESTAEPTASATAEATQGVTAEPTAAATGEATQEGTSEPGDTEEPGTAGDEVGVHLLISANELTGLQLLDPNREPIGTVVNAIIDDGLDRILYILVEPVDEAQLGDNEYLAVPTGAFNVEYENNDWRRGSLYLLVEPNIVMDAPSLNTSDLDLSDPGWDAELQDYWSSQIETENP